MRGNAGKIMRNFGIIVVLCLCVTAQAHAVEPQGPQDSRRAAFHAMAQDIISGLDRTRRMDGAANKVDTALAYLRYAYDYVQGEQLRIAVAPFVQDDLKINKAVADEFNDSLFAALIEKGGQRYDLMARQNLNVLINDMHQTGAWEAADGNPINALLQNAGNVDVLIRGRIRISGRNAVLTYTALGMDGRILAQTAPQQFTLRPEDAKITRSTVTLDRAIADAAQRLADQTPELEELRLGGVRFEDTGIQPAFGRYVEGRLSVAIHDSFANLLTGRSIKVGRLQASQELTRGIVSGKELQDRNLVGDANAYVLSGTYWELPGSIELRVELKGPSGVAASWVGWIGAQDTAGRRLRPDGDFGSLRDNDGLGPFAFHLTSDRGKNAAYGFTEKMKLLIRVDREAWIYCFYRDAAGSTIQILPNPHFWKSYKQPRFEGGVVYTVPEEPRFNFEFTVSPPAGQELVKCFAVSRDVTAELPQPLQGQSLTPLPRDLALQLSPAFQALKDAAVSEASFVVTVKQK